MISVMEDRMTGFAFHPKFEKIKGKKVLKSLEVEFLESGSEIDKKTIENINEKELDKLQEQLLYSVIMNLGIELSRNEAKRLSKIAKKLKVTNMFKICIISEHEDGTMDIKIEFIKSGYFCNEFAYIENISKSDLKQIEDILSDNTENNLKCTRQCEATTYRDSLMVIYQKINK